MASRPPRLRLVPPDSERELITQEGRPAERRAPISLGPLVVRLLTVGWSITVVAALFDAFAMVPQLPFLTAMGMTAVLVAGMFALTRDGVPDWRGDLETKPADAPQANDLLTDLPTFNYFQQRLGDEFDRTRRMGKQVSVVLVDVNNLTAVNKEYGVKAGDEVLRHVARAVDGTRRFNDVVCRLGDDEFGVLLLDCAEDGVRAFIDRLEDRLAKDSALVEVGGRAVTLWAGVCSGTATSSPQVNRADDVLAEAMASLNQAKHDRERRRRMWLSA